MKYGIAVLIAFTLAGCDDKPPAKTVFDPYLQAKEKARAVEAKVQESAQQRNTAVEQSTGKEQN